MAEAPPPADQPATDPDRERQELGRTELSEEIAARYSPDRLTKLVVDQAGRGEHLRISARSRRWSVAWAGGLATCACFAVRLPRR